MVLSCQLPPWGKMSITSKQTWDSVPVEGLETVFYYGRPFQENNGNDIYFDYEEGYDTLGFRDLDAYQWALDNKHWDFMVRINSSCYVHKRNLLKHLQTLPSKKIYSGLAVDADPKWMWGGGQYIISRDVVQGIVDNKSVWNHSLMEDVAQSYVVNHLGVSYTNGMAASIDKKENGYLCQCYNGDESIEFNDFNSLKDLKTQHFFRVKQDHNRSEDKYVMEQLYKMFEL